MKNDIPHIMFNTPENQNYIGPIPSKRDYGLKNTMPEDYKKITPGINNN